MMSVAAKKGLQYWFQRAESDPITAAVIAAELDKEISASSGSEPTLAYRKVSFSSAFSKNNPDLHYPYELVGIVVHSGQANAGHYYSYIKVIFVTYIVIFYPKSDIKLDVQCSI